MEFENSFTAQVYKSVIRLDMSKANEEANLRMDFLGHKTLNTLCGGK